MHEGAERARLLENSRGKRERGALETSAKLAVIGAVACPPPRDNRLVRVRIINAAFFSLSLSLSLPLPSAFFVRGMPFSRESRSLRDSNPLDDRRDGVEAYSTEWFGRK